MSKTTIAVSDCHCYAQGMGGAESMTALHVSSANLPTGASMKLSISYKHVNAQQVVEGVVERQVEKLNTLLQNYSPDLLQLHGVFSENPHKEEHSCVLNLTMPTGALHATGVGANVQSSCKIAFKELEGQVKKHKSLLRKDYEWKRKRPRIRVDGAAL